MRVVPWTCATTIQKKHKILSLSRDLTMIRIGHKRDAKMPLKSSRARFLRDYLSGLLFGTFLIFVATSAFAQEFTGRIADTSGLVIPKAKIVVHNVDTGVDVSTESTESGNYTIPYLKPGSYQITATRDGFATTVRTGLTLQVGQTSTVNFILKVGATVETITVTANSLLDYGKADNGEVVEKERVTELPLNGRNPEMLSVLSAGVIWTGYIGYQRPMDYVMQNLSINGGGSGQNEIMIDGVSNEASSANNAGNSKEGYVPPDDAVQEFKIVTNPYDAQYGRTAGGVVDMTLKSGTNTVHGTVYEFARRSFLDANTWQNDYVIARAVGTPDYATTKKQYQKPQHSLDQYGGELDGPIILPKLYKGRDKSFFLLQFENWHEIFPGTDIESVPDPAWINGDFSTLTYLTGYQGTSNPLTIYNPKSVRQDSNGNWVRDPFDGNIIRSGLNPIAQKILSYFPKPNFVTPGVAPYQDNYVVPAPELNLYRNVLGRWDENVTAKDRFWLRYGYWERYQTYNSNGLPFPLTTGEYPYGNRSHTFAAEETHTFTPNLLFDLRAVVIVRADFNYSGVSGFDPTTLGWPSSLVHQFGPAGQDVFPVINLNLFNQIGNSGPQQTVNNSFSLLPSVTWIKDKHTIHAGLDARFMQTAQQNNGGLSLGFGTGWTVGPYYNDNQPGVGFPIADFLLGLPGSGSVTLNESPYWSQHYWAPFFQDDWKITRRLTFNLGVRWDFNPSAVERHNGADYTFDTITVNPIDPLVDHTLIGTIRGGPTFLGVGRNPRSLYALNKSDIQPRVGFAYAVNAKTVIRGGFGELFKNPQPGANTTGFSYTTNVVTSLDGGIHPNPAVDLTTPFTNVVQPPGASNGLQTGLGQSPWYLNPKYKIPNVWNFSFGIEQQFGQNTTLNLGYVGTRTYNNDTSDNINHQLKSDYVPCNLDLGGNPNPCYNNRQQNPFYGISAFAGSGYDTSPTLSPLTLHRPYPQFQDVSEYQQNEGQSAYNSLQLTAMHRFNKTLTLHGTWTWSKQIDSGGWVDTVYRIPYRSLDGNDRPNRITISGVYMLPVGRGRALLGGTNRLVDTVVGGWELGSLYVHETGWPWSIGNSSQQLGSISIPRHIDKSNGFIVGARVCMDQWYENSDGTWSKTNFWQTYNYSGFTCPNERNVEYSPSYAAVQNLVYSGVRVPNDDQFDVNLSKNFAIKDRLHLQLRMEAFNVLNHPLWQEGYDSNAHDITLGEILRGPSGQSNVPREVQIAAKLVW